MGADAFVAFYGLRHTVPVDDDDEIELLEVGRHPLQIAARAAKLDSWWGRLTDGSDYHVFVGKSLGVFGVENDPENSTSHDALSDFMAEVQHALQSHGLTGAPALHLQLEAQY